MAVTNGTQLRFGHFENGELADQSITYDKTARSTKRARETAESKFGPADSGVAARGTVCKEIFVEMELEMTVELD